MSIDPYAPCLCGSGKKLKFCCVDLAGDLEKIHRMIEGEQPHAALRHVEKTLAKYPDRASLLDLQALLELTLGELDRARATIEAFLKAHPQNASALADHALLLSKTEGGRAALLPLQKALAQIKRNMPRRVLEAVGAVGHALLVAGHVVAAQAHLWLYTSIAPPDDTRAMELLVRLNQLSGLPTLLRDRLRLRPWPADAPWRPEAEEASRLADLGRWYQAIPIIDRLGQQHGADPALVYNRAVMGGWLADERALVAGFHAFARLDVPYDDAVEAEAIAQLIDPNLMDPTFATIKRVYAIRDMDMLEQRLASDKRAELYDVEPASETNAQQPRHAYILLNQPASNLGASITRDQVPSVLGFLSVYGRRTDRAERLEFVVDRDPQLASTLDVLAEVVGDAVREVEEEQTVGSSSQVERALSWRWHFPDDTPPSRRRELLADERRNAIIHRWPDVARATLGGKSPREAASDPTMQIPLAAAVLVLEQGSGNAAQGDALAELRKVLNLPQPEAISADEVDVSSLPLVRVPRLKLDTVSDRQLAELYHRAMVSEATAAVVAISQEALRRSSVADMIPLDAAYQQLIARESDPAEALKLINEARTRSEDAGQSTASWDLAELEIHMSEGNIAEAQRTLGDIDRRHGDDPEVAAAVYQLLYEAGVLQPEDLAPTPGPRDASPSVTAGDQSATRVWTPGTDEPSGKKPQLWTPS